MDNIGTIVNSGRFFKYNKPHQDDITIDDIVCSLSKICRYAGNTNEFYSVAQHCCHVSDACPDHMKLEGLLHDAAETYIGDIPGPFKNMFPKIKQIEDKILNVIYKKYGVIQSYESHKTVSEIDRRMLINEVPILFTELEFKIDGLKRLDIVIPDCWDSDKAKEEFLKRFNKLTSVKGI